MGYIYGFLSVLLMASGPVMSKFVVLSVSPLSGGLINCTVSSVFYALLYWPLAKYKRPSFCSRLMAAGALNAIGLLCLYFALLQVHPAIVGLMNRLGIVFAMLLSFAFMQLRPKRSEIVFGVIALVGAVGAVGLQVLGADFLGIGLALISMMAFTGSQFFLKQADGARGSYETLLQMNIWSSILIFAVILFWPHRLSWPEDAHGWGIVLASTLIGSCLGYLFYLKSLRQLTFSMATILRATSPIFTALIAIPFFGFNMNVWQTSSAAVLLLSIVGYVIIGRT